MCNIHGVQYIGILRYSPAHVYSQEEIRTIILRGIRVIPEFETPSHVNAFGNHF